MRSALAAARADIIRRAKGMFLPSRCAVELLDDARLRVRPLPVGASCPAITIDLGAAARNLESVLAQYRIRLERQGYLAN